MIHLAGTIQKFANRKTSENHYHLSPIVSFVSPMKICETAWPKWSRPPAQCERSGRRRLDHATSSWHELSLISLDNHGRHITGSSSKMSAKASSITQVNYLVTWRNVLRGRYSESWPFTVPRYSHCFLYRQMASSITEIQVLVIDYGNGWLHAQKIIFTVLYTLPCCIKQLWEYSAYGMLRGTKSSRLHTSFIKSGSISCRVPGQRRRGMESPPPINSMSGQVLHICPIGELFGPSV